MENQENSLKTQFNNKLEIFKCNINLLVMMNVPVKEGVQLRKSEKNCEIFSLLYGLKSGFGNAKGKTS